MRARDCSAEWMRPNIRAEGQTHTTAIRPTHSWKPKRGTVLRLLGAGRPDLVLPRSTGGMCIHASVCAALRALQVCVGRVRGARELTMLLMSRRWAAGAVGSESTESRFFLPDRLARGGFVVSALEPR